MNLADTWRIEKYENISIISPDTITVKDFNLGIYETIKILKANGITIPLHTVLIFPTEYSSNEVPFSFPEQNLILIFPIKDDYYHKKEYVMFQYFHEIGHLLTGNFVKANMWVGELLACSCNFFFYPKNNIQNSFYDINIKQNILSVEHNKIHFNIIKSNLLSNPYLVYKGQHQIQSALYSYGLIHEEFNFVALLNEFITYRNNPEELSKLILKIHCIINWGDDKIEFKE